MTDDELTALSIDIDFIEMSATFYDVPVLITDTKVGKEIELAGSAHTLGQIDASNLPAVVGRVLDAAPDLLALVRAQRLKLEQRHRGYDVHMRSLQKLYQEGDLDGVAWLLGLDGASPPEGGTP